jgi:hypothetical protein
MVKNNQTHVVYYTLTPTIKRDQISLKDPLLHFLNIPHKYLSIHKALTFQAFQIFDQCAKNNQNHDVQQT